MNLQSNLLVSVRIVSLQMPNRGGSRAVYWGDETFSRLLFFRYKGKGIWFEDWVCFINNMQICAVAGCGISEGMIYIHILDKRY